MSQSTLPPNVSTGFLVDLVPVKHRKRVYAGFGAVGAILGILTAAFAAVTEDMPPSWLVGAIVVYTFITPFFSALATANAVPTGTEAANEGLSTDVPAPAVEVSQHEGDKIVTTFDPEALPSDEAPAWVEDEDYIDEDEIIDPNDIGAWPDGGKHV